MTDSPDPIRRDPTREPAIIDGKATVIDDGAPQAAPAADPVPQTEPDDNPDASLEGARAENAARAEGPAEPFAVGSQASTSIGPKLAPAVDDRDPPPDAPLAGRTDLHPEPAPRGRRFGSLLAASLLGGLLGGGAVLAYQMTRPETPAPADPRIPQLQQQLGALPRPDALQTLERRLATLETGRGEIDQRIAAAQAAADRAAGRAEEALNRPAPAAPASAPAAAPQAGPAAAPAQAPATAAALNDVTNRLSGLEGQLREQAQSAGSARQGLEQRIAEAAQRLGSLDERTAAVDQRTAGLDQRTAALDQRLGALDQRTGTLDQRLGQLSQQLPALSQQISGLSGRLGELRPDTVRAGLRVIVADRLVDALDRGTPYAEALGSLRQFEAKPERIAALEPFAQSGAPSAASLAQSFKPVRDRILRDTRGPDQNVGERLLHMFDRVVTIRSIEDTGSGTAAGLVARIEDSLERGALGDAAAAWDALPEPSRQAAAEWGQKLKARAAADAAARQIASDAIAALNAPAR